MNLIKLFEMQKVLDDRIIKEHGLEDENLMPNLLLALLVEIGECANEWRGFKHWSKDQKPRTEKLLVEYVDCLHFILCIGNWMNLSNLEIEQYINKEDPLDDFNEMFILISQFSKEGEDEQYLDMFEQFVSLGKSLGFTWDQIEKAYMDKNSVNHDRQTNGY